MAHFEKTRPGGNFSIVSELHGKKIEIPTGTTSHAIAWALKRKIDDLEAAYMCGLDPCECGLSDWLLVFRDRNPEAYSFLAKEFGLIPIDDEQKQENLIEEGDKPSTVCEIDKPLEINTFRYSGVLPDMDRIVYSQAKTRVNLIVFLTQKTARQHGITDNSRGKSEGWFKVKIGNNCSGCQWKFESGAYQCMIKMKTTPTLERKWEMYAPIFSDDCTIIRGKMLAKHTLPPDVR